jgi:hypothetical protein
MNKILNQTKFIGLTYGIWGLIVRLAMKGSYSLVNHSTDLLMYSYLEYLIIKALIVSYTSGILKDRL